MKRILTVVRNEDTTRTTVASFVEACEAVGIEAGPAVYDPEGIVAIGGDGTVLGAAARAIEADLPVCGINVGRVGYLAEFKPSDIGHLAGSLANETYSIKTHGTVGVEIGDHIANGINDVVVEKARPQRIIEIEVMIDHELLATYRTDGIIAATPLGSTAYSLSAGGPIVSPELDALVLTPVAPHSLLSRAIVLAPDARIDLAIRSDRPATVNVDGRHLADLEPGATITVRRGTPNCRFISLGQHPFPHAVREQFGLDHA
ncbi:MAG: NAD(+)/NADH kinase [Acidimicrobiia bacterium]